MNTDDPRLAARAVPPVNGFSPGRNLAVVACVLLAIDTLVLAFAAAEFFGLLRGGDLPAVSGARNLPVALYFAWALSVFASIAVFAAIALYRYRERWFWRCLVAAAVVWLAFPPVLTVVGLVALIVLIHSYAAFKGRRGDVEHTPRVAF
jgi:hypothetical protein